MDRNIIVISGGGFSEGKDYIDEYILKISRKQSPLKIAFIATASNDAQGYIDKFYKSFKNENPIHLTIKDFESEKIQSIVNDQDIVYVGGGDTQYMIRVWKEIGFDIILRNAYQQGVIIAGISAGAMCWFETCFSETIEDEYEEFKGLGILDGCLCPHYNDEVRRKAYDNWVVTQKSIKSYTLDDNENLHFKNEKLIAKIIAYESSNDTF